MISSIEDDKKNLPPTVLEDVDVELQDDEDEKNQIITKYDNAVRDFKYDSDFAAYYSLFTDFINPTFTALLELGVNQGMDVVEKLNDIDTYKTNLYLISPLYIRGENVRDALDYYNNVENHKNYNENNVVDSSRVSAVRQLVREDHGILTDKINGWMDMHGKAIPIPTPIRLYFPRVPIPIPIDGALVNFSMMPYMENANTGPDDYVYVFSKFGVSRIYADKVYAYEKSALDNAIAILPSYFVDEDDDTEIDTDDFLLIMKNYVEINEQILAMNIKTVKDKIALADAELMAAF